MNIEFNPEKESTTDFYLGSDKDTVAVVWQHGFASLAHFQWDNVINFDINKFKFNISIYKDDLFDTQYYTLEFPILYDGIKPYLDDTGGEPKGGYDGPFFLNNNYVKNEQVSESTEYVDIETLIDTDTSFDYVPGSVEEENISFQDYSHLPNSYTNSLGMEFVLIPPGKYIMGALSHDKLSLKGERPRHLVYITKPFYMSKYPITQEEWEKVMGGMTYFYGDCNPTAPMEGVTFYTVLAYIIKLQLKEGIVYRLPTEAEWEYAARAGNEFIFIHGDDDNLLHEYAWFEENSEGRIHPVGLKKPNQWGLYDIIGNVEEYCIDNHDFEFYINSPKIDPIHPIHPIPPSDIVVCRGGSFHNDRTGCRLSKRFRQLAELAYNCVGFRLVFNPGKTINLEERNIQKEGFKDIKQGSHVDYDTLPKSYTNYLGIEFILILPGEYMMGAVPQDLDAEKDESPQKKVYISTPFYISKFLLKYSETNITSNVFFSDYKKKDNLLYTSKEYYDIDINTPSVFTHYQEVKSFIDNLNSKDKKTYRLPTEEEWEYFARAGTSSIYHHGDNSAELEEYAWVRKNSYNTIHPVGQKKPNAWGLYDIIGNVWEWCEDNYSHPILTIEENSDLNKIIKNRIFVLRGGAFHVEEKFSRISYRRPVFESDDENYAGVRLLMSLDDELHDSNLSTRLTEESQKNILAFENEKRIKLEKKQEKLRKEQERVQIENLWIKERNTRISEADSLPKIYKNSLGMEFILIPAGEYTMGAVLKNSDTPKNQKHKTIVRITKNFYLGKYPVLQEKWISLMGSNPSEFKENGSRAPVENVSWSDCQNFIKVLSEREGISYQLPTEAEWEYAARAGTSNIYTFGNDNSKLENYAWYKKNSGGKTHPVGQKLPNSWGLYDMMGNVWEWCEDFYNESLDYKSPIKDPKIIEKSESNVLKGGSFSSLEENLTLSTRLQGIQSIRTKYRGFRILFYQGS